MVCIDDPAVISMKDKDNKKNMLTWLLALTPLIWLSLYVTLAIHCYLALGRWPKPFFENVDIPSVNIHWTLIHIFTYIVFLAIPAWFITLIFQKKTITYRLYFMQMISYVCSFVLIMLVLKFDPTPFTDWFWD